MKYDIGEIFTLAGAEDLYENGLAVIVTDGKYVEVEKDEK